MKFVLTLGIDRRQYRPPALACAVSVLAAWLISRWYRERRQKDRVRHVPVVGDVLDPLKRLRAAFVKCLGVSAFMLRYGPRVNHPDFAVVSRASMREQWQKRNPRVDLLALPGNAPLRGDMDLPHEPRRWTVVRNGLFVARHEGTGASGDQEKEQGNDFHNYVILYPIQSKEARP